MKFHFKKRKIIFEIIFSPSFDVLHSSPIVYMDHTELIFQDILLYCTKKVLKNHNKFFHFRHGGETHFLVLAQTLIYCSPGACHLPEATLPAVTWARSAAIEPTVQYSTVLFNSKGKSTVQYSTVQYSTQYWTVHHFTLLFNICDNHQTSPTPKEEAHRWWLS